MLPPGACPCLRKEVQTLVLTGILTPLVFFYVKDGNTTLGVQENTLILTSTALMKPRNQNLWFKKQRIEFAAVETHNTLKRQVLCLSQNAS